VNPGELLYAETHEWVRLLEEGDTKVAVIGITAFAVEQLVDVTYLEMQPVGSTTRAAEEMGEIESVKAVSSIFSPVQGEIIAVNEELGENLQLLSDDPYQAGWMVKIRIDDETGLEKLMDYAAYEAQCGEEG
jgi:glycine cleavage system H protein